jgi:hypothetical protein
MLTAAHRKGSKASQEEMSTREGQGRARRAACREGGMLGRGHAEGGATGCASEEREAGSASTKDSKKKGDSPLSSVEGKRCRAWW